MRRTRRIMSRSAMRQRRKRLPPLLLPALILLSSCVSFSLSEAPVYTRNWEQPYRSLAYSVPSQPAVRGAVRSTVTIKSGLLSLLPSSAPIQVRPLPQVLSVSGTIQKQLIGGPVLPDLLLNFVTDNWKWSGTISHGDTEQEVEMLVEFTHDNEGGNRQFHVDEVVAGNSKLVPSSQYGNFAEAVPFMMFTASDGTQVYKVALTMDRNWRSAEQLPTTPSPWRPTGPRPESAPCSPWRGRPCSSLIGADRWWRSFRTASTVCMSRRMTPAIRGLSQS